MSTPQTTEDIRADQAKPRQVGDMKHGLTGSRPDMSILPRAGLIYGSRAISYGSDKYARGNYHGPPPEKLIKKHGKLGAEAYRLLGYIAAAQRHLTHISDAVNRALGTGGDVVAASSVVDDEASGGFPPSMLPHMCHALASLLIGTTCAIDGGLMQADPGEPWKALMAGEQGLPQKDNPDAERARVAALQTPQSDAAPTFHCTAEEHLEAQNVCASANVAATPHNIARAILGLREARSRAAEGNRNAVPVPPTSGAV